MSEYKSNYLVVEGVPGLTIAPGATPLTWLNYFDGKFLRAADLTLEQNAQRNLVALSNVAGGFGIVHGLDTSLVDEDRELRVSAGQAIAADGKVLLLTSEIAVEIAQLLAASGLQQAPDLVLVSIAHAEYLCGEDQVFGKLCEEACVTSSDRAHRVEGVVLRARALVLTSGYPSSTVITLGPKHLRSRVASAYFADDRQKPPSLISGAGLRTTVWCLGAELSAGEVPLGVLCQQAGTGKWFDAWTARRERIGRPPRSYWEQRMAMRPWSRFTAQVLQFQCQLSDLLGKLVDGELFDPCADDRATIAKTRSTIDELLQLWRDANVGLISELGDSSVETLEQLRKLLGEATTSGDDDESSDGKRILIDGGIVELPPAGYLPVDPGAKLDVPEQVRRWMGPGVDLRFCVVDADDVPRELVGAQHNDRISLLAGIDDPQASHQVDVLVPDGTLIIHEDPGLSFRAQVGMGSLKTLQKPYLGARDHVGDGVEAAELEYDPKVGADASADALIDEFADKVKIRLRGAARATPGDGGGGAFYLAASTQSQQRGGRLSLDPLRDLRKLPADYLDYRDGMKFEDEAVEEPAPAQPAPAQPAPAQPAPEGHESEADEKPTRVGQSAVWIEMRIDTDPFVVGTSSAQVDIELRQANSAGSSKHYHLAGRIDIESHRQKTGVSIIEGTLTGVELADDKTTDAYAKFIATRLEGGADKTLVVIRLKSPTNVGHNAFLVWDGRNLRSSGSWVLNFGSAHPFYVQDIERDEAVRESDDADHLAALQAVQAIANAFEEPEFAPIAAEKLFPEEVSRIEIQAKRDWVMFHARHRRECEPKPPCRVTEGQRVYGVYVLPVKSEEEYRKILEQLFSGVDPKRRFRQIGSVAFSATGTTLRTSSQTIAQFWTPVGTNRELGFCGVIAAGASMNDGDALHLGRAQELEQIIETISPPIAGQPTQMLTFVPSSISPNDGAIILVSVPISVREVKGCYDAYWMTPASTSKVVKAIENGDWDQLIDKKQILALGEMHFDDDKVVTGRPEVVEAWKKIEPETLPGAVVCVFVGAELRAELHKAHRAELEAEFGVKTPLTESHVNAPRPPRECNAAMLFIPAATQVRVFRAPPEQLEQFKKGIKEGHTRKQLHDEAQVKIVKELLLGLPERVYEDRSIGAWPPGFEASSAWILHADATLSGAQKALGKLALEQAETPGEPLLKEAAKTLDSGSTDLEIIVFG